METLSKTNLGRRKNKIVRYVFIATVILSMGFSAFSSLVFLTDNSGQDLCTYKYEEEYRPAWYEVYSIVNDEICVWTGLFYFMIVYLFFLAFLPLQIGTLGVWLICHFISKRQKSA